jgi:kynurenine formamidase
MPETVWFAGRPYALYDLSDCLSNATSTFEPNPHHIEYHDSATTAEETRQRYGLGREYWPGGHAYNVEIVTLSTHAGTHVDAPYHYGPARHGQGRTIDQVPLRWCCGNGVRLDFRHKEPGSGITAREVEEALAAIEYRIQPFDIVLIMTGASRFFGQPGYDQRHAGLRRDATEWLVDRGVRLIGIDAWGLDRPFSTMAEEARAGNLPQLWESHVLGREKEYCQIERLRNLELLPSSHGFLVLAFPVKLERASAGWARVVALVETEGRP